MLTRYPQNEGDEDTKITTNITINKLILHEYSQVLKKQFEILRELQHKDIKLKRIIDRIQSAPNKYFVIHQNLLFSTNGKNEYRLIHETHLYLGHVGTYKVYQVIHTKPQTCITA